MSMTRALRRADERPVSRRAPARWSIAGAVATLSIAAAGHAQAAAPGGRVTPAPATAVQASASPLARPITLELVKVPLAQALRAIDQRADLGLAFTSQTIPAKRIVSLSARDMPAGEALKRVLAGTGVVVRETPSGQIMLVKEEAPERRSAVDEDTTGHAAVVVHVVDSASRQALVGVVVGVRGTRLVATTAEQGYAVLRDVPSGIRSITVRFLGYAPAERQVVVPDTGYVRVDFALRMGMTRLQDVVTTATGPRRRYELGMDVTVLNADSIVATQPITNMTQLLEGRVAGLTVQHTNGAPGSPSRLRLRGVSSVTRSNDPIVIVDGIRVYAEQSDSLSANLASKAFGAPSPIDQIDPNTVETVEVMKGPSAAALYGPDAANGVIVITTKKGRAGPTRWTASLSRGLSYMPGGYPDGIYRLGESGGIPTLCALTDFQCNADTVIRFQALNESKYTVLGHGATTSLTLGASGGTNALTYSITGRYDDETGIVRLPDAEARNFQLDHGMAPPSWMRAPEQYTTWGATSALSATLNDRVDVSLTSMLTHGVQQQSTLQNQLTYLMTMFVDPVTGTYWRGGGAGSPVTTTDVLVPDFYKRVTDEATTFNNGARLTWRARHWLTLTANAGINVGSRQDGLLLPRGMLATAGDSGGRISIGNGTTVKSTVGTTAQMSARVHDLVANLGLAVDFSKTSVATLTGTASDIAPGTTSLNGAKSIENLRESSTNLTSLGLAVSPSLTYKHVSISTGLRFDGSSAFGSDVKFPIFPQLSGSWMLSEEPFFPFRHLFSRFRLRAAYGQAGVWPAPGQRLRLYKTSQQWYGSSFQDVSQLSSIGNTRLKPERSTELEGGFDADFLNDRLSIGLNGYRNVRHDALISVPVAPSVYGIAVTMDRNIGEVRNTGVELSVTAELLTSDLLTWSTTFSLSHETNRVTRLGAGVLPFFSSAGRVAEGYPLFGRWAKPILGYADVNGNGVIERSEVQLGDTMVYLGSGMPSYSGGASTTLSLFRRKLTVSADFTYDAGLSQQNQAIGGTAGSVFTPGAMDPSASFAQQAAAAVLHETNYGFIQTVSSVRLNSLSVAFNASPRLARRFGAEALSIALQGRNLGLWTNYTGKDPNVNANVTGNAVVDTGVLPQPRTWYLTVRASY
jgi:TonB-linked SusC/RagA family outer membrane protein